MDIIESTRDRTRCSGGCASRHPAMLNHRSTNRVDLEVSLRGWHLAPRGPWGVRDDHGRPCRWGKALKVTRDLLNIATLSRCRSSWKTSAREGHPLLEAKITARPWRVVITYCKAMNNSGSHGRRQLSSEKKCYLRHLIYN